MPERPLELSPNFLGLPPDQSALEDSSVLVLPVPYEATTSYGQGTRFGPRAILEASTQVELYDHLTRTEAGPELGFHTLAPFSPESTSHESAIPEITRAASPLYESGKFVLSLGGEHSITAGLVGAAARAWKDLCIVHVDAHADLRDSWEGTSLSHACAARRALEHLEPDGSAQLVQVGIRNISTEGDAFRRANEKRIRTFWAADVVADRDSGWLDEVERLVAGRDVYLTFDLDGLDSSIMPATGTPEPGGLLWHHAVSLIERVARCAEVKAADVVELAPQAGNHAPDFLAAKLCYLIARRALGA